MELAAYLAKAYQFGYVCRDIEACADHFRKTLGIREFFRTQTDIACLHEGAERPFRIKVALASTSDRQIELIEPVEGVNDFYNGVLEASGRDVMFHHVGVLVSGGEDAWQAIREDVQSAGYPIEVEDKVGPGITRHTHFLYIDTRPLFGHRLEFLWRDAEADRWHVTLPNAISTPAA